MYVVYILWVYIATVGVIVVSIAAFCEHMYEYFYSFGKYLEECIPHYTNWLHQGVEVGNLMYLCTIRTLYFI